MLPVDGVTGLLTQFAEGSIVDEADLLVVGWLKDGDNDIGFALSFQGNRRVNIFGATFCKHFHHVVILTGDGKSAEGFSSVDAVLLREDQLEGLVGLEDEHGVGLSLLNKLKSDLLPVPRSLFHIGSVQH